MSDVRTYQILERLWEFVEAKKVMLHPEDMEGFDMIVEIGGQVESEMAELELPPGWLAGHLAGKAAGQHYDLDQ